MNQILNTKYRGIRCDNGEWVEGHLFDDGMVNVEHYFIGSLVIELYKGTADDDWDITGTYFYEVDPETICQYIKLKDDNGNMVWENDIVLCELGEVAFGYREYRNTILVDNITNYQIMAILQECENLKVLGNMFDNPELLNRVWNRRTPNE